MKKRRIERVYWLLDTERGVELWTAEAEVWDSGFFKIPGTSRRIKDFPKDNRDFAEKELKEFCKI